MTNAARLEFVRRARVVVPRLRGLGVASCDALADRWEREADEHMAWINRATRADPFLEEFKRLVGGS